MTRQMLFGVLLLLSSAVLSAAVPLPAPGSAAPSEWTQEKSELGVTVYTRSVEGSSIREFRGEGIVSVPIEEIVALLRTPARFKDWFPNTSESKLIKKEGDSSYQYSVMEIPWPISDRDNVLRTRLTTDDQSGRVDITVEAAPDAYPIQRGRHRVTKARGSWLLEPRENETTFVRFQMHLEPGGGLPDWMVNARTVGTPFDALLNLRKILGASDPTRGADVP